jgi:hypothetical protein
MSSPDDYPQSVHNSRVGFYQFLATSVKNKPDTNHHQSHIYEGAKYFIHSPYETFSSDSVSHQTIYGHHMIVYLSPQKTIIDKTLEHYPLDRFSNHFCLDKQLRSCSF